MSDQSANVTLTGGAMLALTFTAPVLLVCFIVFILFMIALALAAIPFGLVVLAIIFVAEKLSDWRWRRKRRARDKAQS